MESNKSLLHLFLFFLLVGMASSSYISNGVFEPDISSTGRSLLQQKKTCTVDFENMNYTVITSKCKGPQYTRERCCPPLKELLCPVKDQVNDLKSDCADTFFSYANLYGRYPPGLFAALCREDKEGLNCDGFVKSNDGAAAGSGSSAIVVLVSALLHRIRNQSASFV